ncbi:MAG TPA: glycosyltransferase family 4 protein [bacterium]|nr:glycosyltransferase family 4 protein [bacterium]
MKPAATDPAPRAVHQVLAVFDPDDAQGAEALKIREALARGGLASEIYAEVPLRPPALPLSLLPPRKRGDDTLVYHYSIGSGAGEVFRRYGGRQVLLYHNVTPERFFRGWDDAAMLECRRGRRLLPTFAASAWRALADSEFNAGELRRAGFAEAQVLPYPSIEEGSEPEPDREIVGRFGSDGETNVLFVGRMVPNKRPDAAIAAFARYREAFDPGARLFLVGETAVPSYRDLLRERAGDPRRTGVRLAGKVSPARLRAYYRIADLFLCLSEHEGFGVPLVESMRARVPVLAAAAAAVPETLGGAGFLIERRDPGFTAACMRRILTDRPLRERLLAAQDRRLEEIRAYPFAERLLELLA